MAPMLCGTIKVRGEALRKRSCLARKKAGRDEAVGRSEPGAALCVVQRESQHERSSADKNMK